MERNSLTRAFVQTCCPSHLWRAYSRGFALQMQTSFGRARRRLIKLDEPFPFRSDHLVISASVICCHEYYYTYSPYLCAAPHWHVSWIMFHSLSALTFSPESSRGADIENSRGRHACLATVLLSRNLLLCKPQAEELTILTMAKKTAME